MSWLIRARNQDAGPLEQKWICDHCAEVYRVIELTPQHVREPKMGVYNAIAALPASLPVGVSAFPLRVVHYCSDACVAPYDGLDVEKSLLKMDEPEFQQRHTRRVKGRPLGSE